MNYLFSYSNIQFLLINKITPLKNILLAELTTEAQGHITF